MLIVNFSRPTKLSISQTPCSPACRKRSSVSCYFCMFSYPMEVSLSQTPCSSGAAVANVAHGTVTMPWPVKVSLAQRVLVARSSRGLLVEDGIGLGLDGSFRSMCTVTTVPHESLQGCQMSLGRKHMIMVLKATNVMIKPRANPTLQK